MPYLAMERCWGHRITIEKINSNGRSYVVGASVKGQTEGAKEFTGVGVMGGDY